MKKSLVSTLAAVLALLLLLSVFVSCGDSTNTSTTTNAEAQTTAKPEETEEDLDPHIAATDWEGADFNVLYNGGSIEPNLDFVADDLDGTQLNDAIYNRNLFIQEKYNLVIKREYKRDSEGNGAVRIANASGDEKYHIVELTANTSLAIAVNGDTFPYSELTKINTSKPYWFSTAVAGSSIRGENYFAYCDANIYSFAETPCVIFNKVVRENFGLDDIYTLVRNREWTFDEMIKMDKIVTDVGFDGNSDFTKDDRMGLIANSFCVDCFFSGTGYQMITKDENDLPVLNIENETYFNILDAITALCSVENGCFLCNRYGSTTEALQYWTEYAITDNRALFWVGNFFCVERMRVTDTDYGVIPMPLLNKDQKDYKIHMQADNGGAISVPKCVQDPEAVSAVIEDIAYQSSKTVMPTYMEVLIQGKSVRDNDSLECIKIIRNSYYCDLSFMTKTYGIDLLTKMRTIVEKNQAASSFVASVSGNYQKRLDSLRGHFQ